MNKPGNHFKQKSDSAYFIGMMSGTSLDGVDVVIAAIPTSNNFSLLHAKTYAIPEQLKESLLQLSQERQLNELDHYAELDVQMGHLFASCCQQLLQESGFQAEQICAIGNHGQTLRHYPDGEYPTTLQIGDPNIIVQKTGITTIADFRRRDMAAGGQGAPLVPPFHQAFFKDKSSNNSPSTAKNRVILNIGGIANITYLPLTGQAIQGYDTGPGNGLMDDWCLRHFDCSYDDAGKLASQGSMNQPLLSRMLSDPYFSQSAPKSTGREYFSYDWITSKLDELLDTQSLGIEPPDILATLLELTCQSIVNEIKPLKPQVDEILVCGGGAHNSLLMQRLQELAPGISVNSTEHLGLHPDWVEASAFAWLAHQTLNGLTGNLPSVTGASKEVILGAIWPA